MFRDVNNRLVNLVRRLRGDDQEAISSENHVQIQGDQTSLLVDNHTYVTRKTSRTDQNCLRTDQGINEKTRKQINKRKENDSSKHKSADGVRNREMNANITILESLSTNDDMDDYGVPGGPLDEIFPARTCVASSNRSQGSGLSELRIFDWFNF